MKSWSGKIYKRSTEPGGGTGYYCWIDPSGIPEAYEFTGGDANMINVGGMRLERGPTGAGVFSNEITVRADSFAAFQDFDIEIRFQRTSQSDAGQVISTFPVRFDHSREYTWAEVFGGKEPAPVPPVNPPPVDPPVDPPNPPPLLTLPAAPLSRDEVWVWAHKLTEYLKAKGV